LSAGNVPTIPFLQHSITSSGPEIKNIGAAITGRDKRWIRSVPVMGFLLDKVTTQLTSSTYSNVTIRNVKSWDLKN
jgi:hypothetical protein